MIFHKTVTSYLKYLPLVTVLYPTVLMYMFTCACERGHVHIQTLEHREALSVRSLYPSPPTPAPTATAPAPSTTAPAPSTTAPAPSTTAVSRATQNPASNQEELPGKLPVGFSRFGDRCQSMQVEIVANIKMADTATLDWVCTKRSESLVLEGMLYLLKMSHPLTNKTMTARVGQRRKRPKCHVLDVSSNSGFYGLVGMAHGCDATFFDIQRTCVDMVNKAVELNSHLVGEASVHRLGVSDAFDIIPAPQTDDCSGQLPLIRPPASTLSEQHANGLRIVPLTGVVPRGQTVLILKIDTEGHEYGVLKGALPLFQSHQILNAFVEVTPCCHFWDNAGVSRAQVSEIFDAIVSYGYGMWVLGDSVGTSKYYNAEPVLLESANAIHDYILNTDFMQQDMWLYSQAASPLSSLFKFQRP